MSKSSLVDLVFGKMRSSGILASIRRATRGLVGERFDLPAKLSMVVIEVTTYCNLKCAGCVRTVHDSQGGWSNRHMSVADFQRTIDSLPPAALLIPQGIGESTMHPDIVELIRIASRSGKFDQVEMNTNALVRSVDFYGTLFEAGLDRLTVSVDSLSEEVIDSVRAGTDLAKLELRLHEFAARFPERAGIRVTVSRWNMQHLPALLNRLNDLGSFDVALQPFFDMGNGGGVLSPEDVRRLEEALDAARDDNPNLKITVEPLLPSKDICRSPWRSPAVTVDGDLKPCCMILHQEQVTFGNVLAESFDSLWHSAAVTEFREQFKRRSPQCCDRCPYYAPRP